MIQSLPQSETLIPNTANPQKAIEYINSYIDNCYCEKLCVDISFMNIIDASYISTMCTAKHFIKYPDGKISWKVSNSLVTDLNKDFSLGNSSYTY